MTVFFNLTQIVQTIRQQINSDRVVVAFEISEPDYLKVDIKAIDGEQWLHKNLIFSTEFLQNAILDEYAALDKTVKEINNELSKVK